MLKKFFLVFFTLFAITMCLALSPIGEEELPLWTRQLLASAMITSLLLLIATVLWEAWKCVSRSITNRKIHLDVDQSCVVDNWADHHSGLRRR